MGAATYPKEASTLAYIVKDSAPPLNPASLLNPFNSKEYHQTVMLTNDDEGFQNALAFVSRRLRSYGIPPDELEDRLQAVGEAVQNIQLHTNKRDNAHGLYVGVRRVTEDYVIVALFGDGPGKLDITRFMDNLARTTDLQKRMKAAATPQEKLSLLTEAERFRGGMGGYFMSAHSDLVGFILFPDSGAPDPHDMYQSEKTNPFGFRFYLGPSNPETILGFCIRKELPN
ncbi:hypothetical protein JXB02_05200 [Candidatus Woesearchaeota archaeon]|nr:hypothetical protein [Candidatus Woesearchaeota archaeon]